MIEFKNVKFNIANIDILSDLSFVIKENSVVSFVGNKNTGKSTILKLIAGIYNNYYGEILIDGKYLEDNDRKIAMVFDKREKYTHLNVHEYISFYGSLYDIEKETINKYIDKMLKKFSLMPYKYTDMDLLDDDSYKLVQIIRAMINNPDIILFDNLFSDVNIEYNEKVHDYIKTLIGKKTIVFACRNIKYMEEITDVIGALDAGTLLTYGDIETVYKKLELNKKIEIKLYDGMQEALELLKSDETVNNVIYEDDKIIFSTNGDEKSDNKILKKLIDNNIKVYSYKKENVTFEKIFGKLSDNTYAKY